MPRSGAETREAPDGGYGWLIVLGSCIANLFTRSVEPSFGLLFGDVLKQLGVGTTGAAFIMSARDATINFSGFFMAPLLKNYSYRKVGILGALLSSFGLIATASASSVTHILLTYSCIGGVGFGLCYCATFIALNTYFKKRRGQAFGYAMSGSALGFMAMPQIISRLLEEFEFHDTMLLMGALCLNALVGISLLQPVKWHLKPVITEEQEDLLHRKEEVLNKLPGETDCQGDKSDPGLPKSHSFSNSLSLQNKISQSFLSVHYKNRSMASLAYPDLTDSILDITMDIPKRANVHQSHGCVSMVACSVESHKNKIENRIGEEKNEKQIDKKETNKVSCWGKLVSIMDLDLLLDISFLNTLFGLSVVYLSEISFKLVIPFFMANLGYTKRDTAQALSLMAITDIIARLTIPPIFDKLPFTRKNTLIFVLMFMMVARSVLAEQTSWKNLIIAILVHGFFRGFTMINLQLVVSEAVPLEKLPSAFGLLSISKGLIVVTLGPLGGWIRDYTGSYSICLHSQSAMQLVCVVFWTVEYMIKLKPPRRPVEPTCST